MIRKILMVTLSGWLFAGLVLAQQVPPLVGQLGYSDIILTGGKIVSMDDRSNVPNSPGHIYEAMAIKGKKIMALGSNEERRRLAGPQTVFIDLGNRAVIPGLIQTHYHLYTPAARSYGPVQGLVDPSVKLTVIAEETAEATAKKVREALVNAIKVQAIPRGQWITMDLRRGRGSLGTPIVGFLMGEADENEFTIHRSLQITTYKDHSKITNHKSSFRKTWERANRAKKPRVTRGSTQLKLRPVSGEGTTSQNLSSQMPTTMINEMTNRGVERFMRRLSKAVKGMIKQRLKTIQARIPQLPVVLTTRNLSSSGRLPYQMTRY